MYFKNKKIRVLEATEVLPTQVTFDRYIYHYTRSWGFSTSGSFWSGGLSVSFGSTGWSLDSTATDQISSQEEIINHIFSDYGSCRITRSGDITFNSATYLAFNLECTNGSQYAYFTVAPDLSVWGNPIYQVVYDWSSWTWTVNSDKTYYVYEINI